MAIKFVELSKVVSHALRHEPWVYELELDSEGWVDLESLLMALRLEREDWRSLREEDLRATMASAEKQRFEIKAGRIRALYGHSVPGKLRKEAARPPEFLYHGTSKDAAERIKEEGLLPMGRQYVHLSVDQETAMMVGKRKVREPVILRIRAREANGKGTTFYLGNEKVWLADVVAPQFIGMEN